MSASRPAPPRRIEKHKLDRLYLVPTHLVRRLCRPDEVKRRYDLSSVEYVATTGSPCPPDVKKQMIDWWGPVINESYASERSRVHHAVVVGGIAHRSGLDRQAAARRRRTHHGPCRRPAAAVRAGTDYCRQAAYPDSPTSTGEADRRAIDRDGLVAAGDVGYFDREGYPDICDRKSDMVISGGVNIYPAEIEAVLITMPEVPDGAVFGIPDAEFGEALAAHVQPNNGAAIERDTVRRVPEGTHRRLQGAAGGRILRCAAARGVRQDLQAAPARSLLERGRAEDLSLPPFRAEHVGSLLRPAALLDARRRLPAARSIRRR